MNEIDHNGEDHSYHEGHHDGEETRKIVDITGMYQDWFLDYASYVILERAVPHIVDGLKPVQRRILHAMRQIDDGRFHKVANIIGHSMQYHPHGDASIGEALIQLGQKELLVDTQGNWGNIFTGDSAAAPRYIEARLSQFAREVLFNQKTTSWKLSYDGRNKEPITLPAKFPILLAQGVEGIAVGLASRILPHNFNELIDAAVKHLQGKPFELVPDFPTGGLADVSKYNGGLRGGVVRSRARIEKIDRKTLAITEIPYGKTTNSLIDSIIKANERGKIKVKRIDDNTAEHVEILIHLANGANIDKTIDALFAFTDCEISISPNCCVIEEGKPRFVDVHEILKISAQHTVDLLQQELQIRKNELEEDWHLSSLEKIFIEQRIYNSIEQCETWESILQTIDHELEPFKSSLKREVTRDDIIKLTEIKIKRISKYDTKKADEHIKKIEAELEEVAYHLDNIIQYAIDYYKRIKQKFGKGRERKTEIRNFETIEATKVIEKNEKLYVNREEGFIGTGLKKDEYVCNCSDIDDIIVFRKDGTYLITKVSEKVYVGKGVLYASVFKKNDKHRIYHIIYRDGPNGAIMAKRCSITGLMRDKEYNITKGTPNSEILYISTSPNGEPDIVEVFLNRKPRLKKLRFTYDFSDIPVKSKNAQGNILTKHSIRKIQLKSKGESEIPGKKIWFDSTVYRLNHDGNGKYLGEFYQGDKILVITKSGLARLTDFDLTNHFEDDLLLMEKYDPEKVHTAIYYDGERKYYYLKRFMIDELQKPVSLIGEHEKSKLIIITNEQTPMFYVKFDKKKHPKKDDETINGEEFIAVKGYKARGKRISPSKITKITQLESTKEE